MDATQLAFSDETFDFVIEKGTLDAVCCSDDYSIPNSILKEMLRVVKKDGFILFITHGNPSYRQVLFENNYDPEQVEIQYRQQLLSPEVNLINVMRSNGGRKTLNEIVKDPELFMKCLRECNE